MIKRSSLVGRSASSGQALLEFAFAFVIFIVLLMGVFDFGRAIFMYNGVSQAAREIARATSLHPYFSNTSTFGQSTETNEVITVQRALVPGMQTPPTFECVDSAGTPYAAGAECLAGRDYVRVTVKAPFQPITPILSFLGSFTFSSSSSVRIPE